MGNYKDRTLEIFLGKDMLSIDIETRSRQDLEAVGVYKYAEDCEVLLISYWHGINPPDDYSQVTCLDLFHGDKVPDEFMEMLTDSKVVKRAYNAQFERVVLSQFFKIHLPVEQWFDTMMIVNYLALPSSLDKITSFLFSGDANIRKDPMGGRCLTNFSKPKYHDPDPDNEYDREMWTNFKRYNRRDVLAECKLFEVLKPYALAMPHQELLYWRDDQEINDRGVMIDEQFINSALSIRDYLTLKGLGRFKKLTGGLSPSQVKAFAKFLTEETGVLCTSVAKDKLEEWEKQVPMMPEYVHESVQLKKLLSKTSLAKYDKMRLSVNSDSRIRGLFRFYGASRTGRFASQLVQVQNLKRNSLDNIEEWRKDVCEADVEYLQALTDNVPDLLSQLIRTAFIAKQGHTFVICDYHAIEAVVAAWLASEQWRLRVFATDGRIYEASAAQMFSVPINTITAPDGTHGENYYLRAKGKIAELALGYGGGVGALKAMGGEALGLSEQEMRQIVYLWRTKSPNIVQMWNNIDTAMRAIIQGTAESVNVCNNSEHDGDNMLLLERENSNFITLRLPSGRKLYYYKPHIKRMENDYGDEYEQLVYWGKDQKSSKWSIIPTRGSKIFENAVQAIARDLLCYAIHNISLEHMDIVMHVHDEIICEVPENKASVEDLKTLMCDLPNWARYLPLTADGFVTPFYRKD